MVERNFRRVVCFHCGGKGHTINECRAREVTCYNCGKIGHVARDCMAGSDSCYICGKSGHFARDCQSAPTRGSYQNRREPFRSRYTSGYDQRGSYRGGSNYGRGGGYQSQPTCYNCGRVGHVAAYCQSKPSNEGNYGKTCYYCGKFGHLAKDCYVSENKRCFICGKLGHLSRDCYIK